MDSTFFEAGVDNIDKIVDIEGREIPFTVKKGEKYYRFTAYLHNPLKGGEKLPINAEIISATPEPYEIAKKDSLLQIICKKSLNAKVLNVKLNRKWIREI